MFRCPSCRTRRKGYSFFIAHLNSTGHRVCNCGHVAYGGTGFPHRPGTPYCAHNPLSILHLAIRGGEPEESLVRLARAMAADDPKLAPRIGEFCELLGLKMAA